MTPSRHFGGPALWLLALAAIACTPQRLSLVCRPAVPREFQTNPLVPPAKGTPEAARYTIAYNAYWWNCLMIRAADLLAHCPALCSGTPAASQGCVDGAAAAEAGIEDLLERFPRDQVQEYLRRLASTAEARARIWPYFGGSPSVETIVPDVGKDPGPCAAAEPPAGAALQDLARREEKRYQAVQDAATAPTARGGPGCEPHLALRAEPFDKWRSACQSFPP